MSDSVNSPVALAVPTEPTKVTVDKNGTADKPQKNQDLNEAKTAEIKESSVAAPEGSNTVDVPKKDIPKRNQGTENDDAICLFGVNKWASFQKCGDELKKHGVDFRYVNKRKGELMAYVYFEDASMKTKNCEILDKITNKKGKKIYKIRPCTKKRKNVSMNDDNRKRQKKQKPAVERKERTARDAVAPLAGKPYEEQLSIKSSRCERDLKSVARKMRKEGFKDFKFDANKGLVCPCELIVPSPQTEGYRNKCEFTIGLDKEGNDAVGFIVGKNEKNIAYLENVSTKSDLPPMPPVGLKVAELMKEFVQQSDHPIYNPNTQTGVWRLVLVRNSKQTKNLMISVQANPTGLDETAVAKLKSGVIDFFKKETSTEAFKTIYEYTLSSLYVQLFAGVSSPDPNVDKFELLWGEPYITEILHGLKFRISPDSFFQVNTPGAEALFTLATNWADCNEKTTLLDICCGTGTIGLTLAKKVGKVVGLEIVESAIENAKINAKENGVDNAVYMCGKAEDTLGSALETHLLDGDVVAIVDPPRAGLHFTILRALRTCTRINRIVYVSCNPATLLENVMRLIQPAKGAWKGRPFTAVKAVPVDMFPHTNHCEAVMLLERTPQ